ncbi:MAG TPA: hypothetical protein VF784_03515 [Anaerolineales bacterium]
MRAFRYGSITWILLAVFLILFGLSLLGVKLSSLSIIMGICALAAGVLLLVNRGW